MKKMNFVWYGFLLLTLVVFVSDGAAQQPITKDDLPGLKGKWEGTRTLTGFVANSDLEISNDTLPLEGKLIFHNIAGSRRGGSPGRSETVDFKGTINDKGNIYIKAGTVEVELSLYKGDGAAKLEGDFSSGGGKGRLLFKKK